MINKVLSSPPFAAKSAKPTNTELASADVATTATASNKFPDVKGLFESFSPTGAIIGNTIIVNLEEGAR